MGRSENTRDVGRDHAQKYLTKAREFSAVAEAALAEHRWNAAGLNAIHAGISAADAAVVASSGLRSSSKDHSTAADLLRDSVKDATASQARQLAGLLGMKNTVEYEQRLVTETEARSLVAQSSRLVRWSAKVVASRLDSDA